MPSTYVIYSEISLENKMAKTGFNRRVFNREDVTRGEVILLDSDAGIITLCPGEYHISGCSIMTAIGDANTDNPGYCVLRDLSVDLPGIPLPHPFSPGEKNMETKMLWPDPDEYFLAVGTICNARSTTPSTFDTYVSCSKPVQIVVEHQARIQEESGQTGHEAGAEYGERSEKPTPGVYLQLKGNGSENHVFARIRIEKI